MVPRAGTPTLVFGMHAGGAAPLMGALLAAGEAPWNATEERELPAVLAQAQAALHVGPAFWHAVLRAPGGVDAAKVTGSIAIKLVVLCAAGSSNTPVILHERAPVALVLEFTDQVRAVLQRKGLGPTMAAAYAAVLVSRVQAINDATLAALDTFFEMGTPHCIVRLALRHVSSIEVNLREASFWFSNGHANVLVLHQHVRAGVLVEPAGVSAAPHLLHALKCALRVPDWKFIHNLHYRRPDGRPPTPTPRLHDGHDDGLCTLWCAIYGLLLVAGSIATPEDFWALFKRVEARRPDILRGFLRLAGHVLHRLSGQDSNAPRPHVVAG